LLANLLFYSGGGKRVRTADLLNAIQALSQLSYTPTHWYGRQDLNLHGFPPDPKSGASANSATPADFSPGYHSDGVYNTIKIARCQEQKRYFFKIAHIPTTDCSMTGQGLVKSACHKRLNYVYCVYKL
jgi:hypothetical protein